ncbi:MAG: polysaccharide lyase [Myxococcota bacterium]
MASSYGFGVDRPQARALGVGFVVGVQVLATAWVGCDGSFRDQADAATETGARMVDASALPESGADATSLPSDSGPSEAGAWLEASGWTNVVFPEVGRTARFEFDMRATSADVDAVVGVTLGRAFGYPNVAMIVRMNPEGMIDVRDGDAYTTDAPLSYTENTPYHVAIDADFEARSYAVTVATIGGEAAVLRTGAGFRSEVAVDTADHLAFYEPENRLEVGNFMVNGIAVAMVRDEPNPPMPAGGLWQVDFETTPLGDYNDARVRGDWPGVEWTQTHGRVDVMDEDGNRFIRVRYPNNRVGPGSGGGGAQWKLNFERRREFYVSYRMRFRGGFDWVLGGKIPGFFGGDANTGGNIPNGNDGWSARMMWKSGGDAVQYMYHPDQPGRWGEDFRWDDGGAWRSFPTDVWITVEHRVVMNTPGRRDGIVQGWYNGELALDRRDVRYRDTDRFAIDGFLFSTFFGGNASRHAANRDEYIDFDDFIFSDRPITH